MDAKQITTQFIAALQDAERTRNFDAVERLFSPQAQLHSIALAEPLQAPHLRKFWSDYVELFAHVKTEFLHTHAIGDLAVLEWRSVGALKGGLAITYEGVTVLEFAGDKIERFRAYYDSAAFLPDGFARLGRTPRG